MRSNRRNPGVACRLAIPALAALMLVASGVRAGVTDPAIAWELFEDPDAKGYIRPNIAGGQTENDFESSQDPTNGGTGVQPSTVDIASFDGSATTGGSKVSSFFGYYDGGTLWNPAVPSTMEDDYVFFRMRISADVRKNTTTTGGFVNVFYNVIIDIDGDGYKEYWVALNGDATANSADTLHVYYEDLNQQDFVSIATAEVAVFAAGNTSDPGGTAPQSYSHARAMPVTYLDPADTSGEWFVEMQVPLTAFNDTSGNQMIFPDSAIGIGFSTGTSNNDPLQKDHAGDYTGGLPYDPDSPIIFPPPIVLVPPAWPSPYPDDGKFCILAGNDLDTFDARRFVFYVGIPAGEDDFLLEFFDGDGGNQSPWYSGHWDWFSSDTTYSLYADPNKDGPGNGTLITSWTGNSTSLDFSSVPNVSSLQTSMPDNDWFRMTVLPEAAAIAPSGNFFYRLEVELVQNAGTDPKAFQAFKLRGSPNTTISVSGLFQFMATISTIHDYRIIYPGEGPAGVPPLDSTDPLVNGRKYSGAWSAFAYVNPGVQQLNWWDGDFDVVGDTDDANTPNTVPAFAATSPGALPEGANAIGIPEDDYGSSVEASAPVAWRLVTPSVRMQLTSPDPDGTAGPLSPSVFTNLDPSGNGEFELFQVGTSSATGTNDVTVAGTQLTPGWWEYQVQGVDINNLNALYIEGELFSRANSILLNPTGAITGALVAPVSPTFAGTRTISGTRTPIATTSNQELILRGTTSTGEVIERTTLTRADGTYTFGDLPAGRYAIHAAGQSTPLRTAALNGGEVRHLDIDPRLRRMSSGLEVRDLPRSRR
jgi:hypothetical protein